MPVIAQRHGSVIEITMDWPEVRNAMSPAEGREVLAALRDAFADESLGAAVLSANGKAFCAGGNHKALLEMGDQGEEAVRAGVRDVFQPLLRALQTSPFPVIAAVDGPAIGFGCDLALGCTATFVGEKGWLAQGWNRAGLIPATGGTLYALKRGGRQALWRFIAADRVDGPTAEAWGLAAACPNARSAALEMAGKLAALPRAPLKALTQLARIEDLEAHLAEALRVQVGFLMSPEFRAIAEKALGR